VARDGLASLHGRLRVVRQGEPETGLGALLSASARHELTAVHVAGGGAAERELAVPYRGERLSGSALLRQLDAWVATGVIESSCADAVRAVAASPEWLALPGRTVVVLGAGAEVGPLPVLLNWGARVIGIDLPRPAIWDRVLETARRSGGTLLVPVADAKPGRDGVDSGGDLGPLAQRAGFDLADDIPAVADWLVGLDRRLVLGNYVYADGAANVRVASAVDVLTVRLQAERRDLALAFLATPTDVFAVPPDAVAQSARAYAGRSAANKLGRGLLKSLSGGRLLRPAYPPGSDPGICDSLVAQQGPNYALAKRLQRWRATVARDGGLAVSMNVAPPTRTRSVTRNRVLAAAYAGAGRFGVEVFEPATTKALMAALLVHDLHAGPPAGGHPWQDEAYAAAHGGLWRMAYAPRSALSLAALLGYAAARNQARGSLPEGLATGAACYPMRGSRLSGCSARPEAASTQARSSARSAGRRPRVRRASRSSRIAAVSAIPSGVAIGARPSARVRSSPWTTASTTRLATNSSTCMGAKYPGPTVPAGTARASSMVFPNVSARTPGMSAGVLPPTMV
jgi:hypothetical protein